MTKEEIIKFLDNTKVYVNGKSKGIQEKLFSFGYTWGSGDKIVKFTNDPFIFIHKDKCFTHSNDMINFVDNEYTEILAEEILSLKLTEPTYRPFKTKEECWNEMQKHQPFGWLKSKNNGRYRCIGEVSWSDKSEMVYIVLSTSESLSRSSGALFDEYTFADDTPFGIKER